MTITEKVDTNKKTAELKDVKINVKMKLSALWVTVMFFYLYADVRTFYEPGFLEEIMAGEVGGMQITVAWLLGGAIIMAIPSLMVFLSLTLKAKANRWANIILGLVYTGVIIITLIMKPSPSYIFYGCVEVVLTALIVWYAWRWPKQERVEVTP